MNVNVFERVSNDEFDQPFDNVNDCARFILNKENNAPVFASLRVRITEYVSIIPPGRMIEWRDFEIDLVRGLSICRQLINAVESEPSKRAIARLILNRAAAFLRGES